MTLADEDAACNMIKNIRIQDTKRLQKTITVCIGEDVHGRAISAQTRIKVRSTTGTVSVTGNIGYRTHCIHPTTNKKLVCTNAHAFEQLVAKRAYQKEYSRKRRAEARAQA